MAGMLSSETRVRVRYAETDQMGIVYYANYFVWMELGRVECLRALGLAYKRMEAEDGVLLAVTEASCRYRSPALYDDEVVVRTHLVESRSRTVGFDYALRRETDGELLATGSTRHAYMGRDGRVMRLPQKYREFLPLMDE